MAVIAAFELDDPATPGIAACEAQCTHGCLGAARHHANLFDGGQQSADHLRNLDFGLGRRAKAEARGQRLLHRGKHLGVHVADDHWPPRADVVDIALAVRIPEIGARRALDETGRAADRAEGAHRGVDAAGDGPLGTFEEGLIVRHRGFLQRMERLGGVLQARGACDGARGYALDCTGQAGAPRADPASISAAPCRGAILCARPRAFPAVLRP